MATEQRFTFDEVAELYDRWRPGYPDALFDDLFSLAALPPGSRILEIGCGTGQATRPLSRRGFAMRCLEPGPALARLARANLAGQPGVEVVETTFEAWPVERGAFGLVVCAQAFHWLAPEVRFAKAAEALAADGALAVVGNAAVLDASPLRAAIDAVYARHAPSMTGPPVTHWYSAEGPIVGLFAASGRFGPVEVRRYPWSRTLATADYCELMRTHSPHRLLPPAELESLLAALADAIRAHGDRIEEAWVAHLYLARRAA